MVSFQLTTITLMVVAQVRQRKEKEKNHSCKQSEETDKLGTNGLFHTWVILHDGVNELTHSQQQWHLLLGGIHLPHVQELLPDFLNSHGVRGHGTIHPELLGLFGLSQRQVLPQLLQSSTAHLQRTGTMHHWYQGFIFSIAYLLIYQDTFLRSSPGSHAKPSRWRCSEVLRHICAWPSPAPGLWKRTHPHTDNRLSTRRNVTIISLSNQIIKCVTVCCAMTS